MATPAELVRDNAEQLAGYWSRLERHIAEPSAGGCTGALSPRHADVPFPGNPAAFGALMVIWEAVPRLEAALRLAVAGHPGRRRGGSARNFLDALEAICALSGGLDEDGEALVARTLDRLNNLARCIPDIDEAEQWRPLPSRACPYCGCWFLKVLVGSTGQPDGRVQCFGHMDSGEPCRASWPGGLLEIGRDLDAA